MDGMSMDQFAYRLPSYDDGGSMVVNSRDVGNLSTDGGTFYGRFRHEIGGNA